MTCFFMCESWSSIHRLSPFTPLIFCCKKQIGVFRQWKNWTTSGVAHAQIPVWAGCPCFVWMQHHHLRSHRVGQNQGGTLHRAATPAAESTQWSVDGLSNSCQWKSCCRLEYLVFMRMPDESYRKRLRSLLLCLWDSFRAPWWHSTSCSNTCGWEHLLCIYSHTRWKYHRQFRFLLLCSCDSFCTQI